MKTEIRDVVGGSIFINGVEYKGASVTIIDGVVNVDNKSVGAGSTPTHITIEIKGDVGSVSTASGDVFVTGDVKTVSAVSGDVNCGDVLGNVTTVSGDVHAIDITGTSIKTVSGDIYSHDS